MVAVVLVGGAVRSSRGGTSFCCRSGITSTRNSSSSSDCGMKYGSNSLGTGCGKKDLAAQMVLAIVIEMVLVAVVVMTRI